MNNEPKFSGWWLVLLFCAIVAFARLFADSVSTFFKHNNVGRISSAQVFEQRVSTVKSLERGDLLVCGQNAIIFLSVTETHLIFRDPYDWMRGREIPISTIIKCTDLRVVRKTDVAEYHREAVKIFSQ